MKQPSNVKWKYETEARKASVLLPLCSVGGQAHVLFTTRSNSLRNHTGEVAFPGGMMDINDKDSIETALRETEEEIGISRHQVQVLGTQPTLPNWNHSIIVTPVVGYIGNVNVDEIQFNPLEVERVFTLSIEHLLNQENYTMDTFRSKVEIPSWPIGNNRIWGLTGYILYRFLRSIQQ